MNKILPRAFENIFILINKTSQHLCNTRGNSLGDPQVKMTYDSNSFTLHAICTCNSFQKKSKSTSLVYHCSLTCLPLPLNS